MRYVLSRFESIPGSDEVQGLPRSTPQIHDPKYIRKSVCTLVTHFLAARSAIFGVFASVAMGIKKLLEGFSKNPIVLKKSEIFEKISIFSSNFVDFCRFLRHPWTFIDPTRPRDRLDSTQNIAQSTALAEYVLKMPKLFENDPLVVENELSKVKTSLNVSFSGGEVLLKAIPTVGSLATLT